LSEEKREEREREEHGQQSLTYMTGSAEYPRTFILSAPSKRWIQALNSLLLVFPDLLDKIEPAGAEPYTGLHNVVHKVGSYVATASDYLIVCNAEAGPFTISLPTATLAGKVLVICKSDASENAVSASCAPSNDTIEGNASISLASQWSKCVLVANGISTWLREV
jgi:hypothetical protein